MGKIVLSPRILGDSFGTVVLEHLDYYTTLRKLNKTQIANDLKGTKGSEYERIFNKHFKENYKVHNVILMGQPYDGFIISKSLITSNLSFFNLNEKYGAGGIQSDPGLTFLHPEIKEKFIHNIGWTGKNQYEMFSTVLERDDILKKVQLFLFGRDKIKKEKKEKIFNKLEKLKKNKIIFDLNKNN